MSKTSIQWAAGAADDREGHSVNPFRARSKEFEGVDVKAPVGHFCVKISPGCQNCYSSRLQSRFQMLEFLAKNRSKVDLFLDESKLQEVLRRKKPTGYFWADMSDMFMDDYPFEWIDKCAAAVALTPQHIHMWLTKRPERALQYVAGLDGLSPTERSLRMLGSQYRGHPAEKLVMSSIKKENVGSFQWPLPNLFLGVSVESRDYKWRIDVLRKIPAAVRFLSIEPLLEDIGELDLTGIHWVIAGGESGRGKNVRPFDLAWAYRIIEMCREQEVPVFIKQLGSVPMESEVIWRERLDTTGKARLLKAINGRRVPAGYAPLHFNNSKGGDIAEFPVPLQVREFPTLKEVPVYV